MIPWPMLVSDVLMGIGIGLLVGCMLAWVMR